MFSCINSVYRRENTRDGGTPLGSGIEWRKLPGGIPQRSVQPYFVEPLIPRSPRPLGIMHDVIYVRRDAFALSSIIRVAGVTPLLPPLRGILVRPRVVSRITVFLDQIYR